MIVEQGWRYYFSPDHPTCPACGRPDLGELCYCINETAEQRAAIKADFDRQRLELSKKLQDS